MQRSLLTRLARCGSGVAAVEMALAAPVILTMILGILSSGSLFFSQNELNHAVGEAARYATISPQPSDQQIRTMALDSYHGTDPLLASQVNVTHGSTANYMNYVVVQAKVQTSLDLVFLRFPGITLVSTKRAYVI
ncbi:MAG: pilus assembly protein [Sphingomonadales bacterium]|nr:pilus assembly protein [Sphingomonadales bacterium]MDE2570059.1 pilus assembly protein [Sphingomonadales bacterium]